MGLVYRKNLFLEDYVSHFEHKSGLLIKQIERNLANDIIKKNHYSGTVVNNSYVHFGLFLKDEIRGVAQFGYAMNPSSGNSIVSGTENKEYLELNRFWTDDKRQPDCKETIFISGCIKLIKKLYPDVGWIQSFADERCGKLGKLYQAANFKYFGEHSSAFYLLDGEIYHKMLATDTQKYKRGEPKAVKIQDNLHRAEKKIFRQFRYIYFINKKLQDFCTLTEKPYPKN